jgi:hypothetical protein
VPKKFLKNRNVRRRHRSRSHGHRAGTNLVAPPKTYFAWGCFSVFLLVLTPPGAGGGLGRLHHPDVQFAQLLRRDLRGRAHHQVFGALVHREQHHFAQVIFAAQQHDDAVDAGRDAAAIREVECWWREERKTFMLASALGYGSRLPTETLRELRLILRLMRRKGMAAEFGAITAAVCEHEIALAAE